MEQFNQFSNGKDLMIGVDFGFGHDFAVATVMKKREDGTWKITDSSVIGRANEMNDLRRQQICEHYEELCKNEAVEQKST